MNTIHHILIIMLNILKSNSEENPLCVEKTKKGVEVILESYLEEREVYVGVKRVEE